MFPVYRITNVSNTRKRHNQLFEALRDLDESTAEDFGPGEHEPARVHSFVVNPDGGLTFLLVAEPTEND